MATIRANGIDIHYVIEGPAEGPVVTMSHSLTTTLDMWAPQVKPLTERGYRVLRYDTRGHGGTSVTEPPYTLDTLAADAAAMLDALGIARTHFVGLSMGGMIGQTLALARPDLFATLTLCDTSSGYPPEGGQMWADRIAAAEAAGLEANVAPTIERWFSPGFAAANDTALVPVRDMIRHTPVKGYVGCCHAISKLALTDRIAAIAVPTLIIVGEDDPGTPVAMHVTINEKIAGSELVILPTARHLSNIESVEPFNKALIAFLDRHR
ncbi:MAG: 3-oxoadipate enol-lactonase [Alphaproteobacteria bacterium]